MCSSSSTLKIAVQSRILTPTTLTLPYHTLALQSLAQKIKHRYKSEVFGANTIRQQLPSTNASTNKLQVLAYPKALSNDFHLGKSGICWHAIPCQDIIALQSLAWMNEYVRKTANQAALRGSRSTQETRE
jgi:hypothetical protein